ncbi:hypothetical protein ACFZBU_43635 [Embleya sp. NPDC008237]|uniref:hypothetical protein n=1 Tax=Embleya sp. NPDC008237 TaxID=3363978 RepID=UPI0036E31CCC
MLIEVLLLHRQLPADAMAAALRTAVRLGSVSADLVAIEARKYTESPPRDAARDQPAGGRVLVLHERRLPPDSRPLPDMAKYDRLLRPVLPPRSAPDRQQRGTSA